MTYSTRKCDAARCPNSIGNTGSPLCPSHWQLVPTGSQKKLTSLWDDLCRLDLTTDDDAQDEAYKAYRLVWDDIFDHLLERDRKVAVIDRELAEAWGTA